MIFNPKFNYYAGDIKKTKTIGMVHLSQLIRAIKSPKPETINLINQIRHVSQLGHDFEGVKAELKQKLFAFTPAVVCEPRRKYENIKSFTGLMPLDFDKLSGKDEAVELKKALFDTFDFIICVWLSSSGKGVRALAKIPVVNSVEEYKMHYHAFWFNIGQHMKGFDIAPQNPVLPLFLSIDNDLLYRFDCDTYTDVFDKEQYDTNKNRIEYLIKQSKRTQWIESISKTGNLDTGDKRPLIKWIINKKLNSITDAGHPILRAIAYAVGGYVGSGYLSFYEAESILHDAIDNHSYLGNKKKAPTYKCTATTMLQQGQKNPLKIENYDK